MSLSVTHSGLPSIKAERLILALLLILQTDSIADCLMASVASGRATASTAAARRLLLRSNLDEFLHRHCQLLASV